MKRNTYKDRILRMLDKGWTAADISEKLGTPPSYVYVVKSERKRKEIADKKYVVRPDFKIVTPVNELVEKAFRAQAKDKQEGGTHYKDMAVQPWDVIDTWPMEQRIGFYRGNALKYTMRMGSKDASAQDIAKARHYNEKLLEVLNESV